MCIEDQDEFEFFSDLFTNDPDSFLKYWIGLTNRIWEWTTGNILQFMLLSFFKSYLRVDTLGRRQEVRFLTLSILSIQHIHYDMFRHCYKELIAAF